nr:ROK family transcriptional regulator [Actinomycetales bacterium]
MSTSSISRANRGRILAEIAYARGLSRAELAERTGLSLATVSRTVAALAAAGLVHQSEAERTFGRPLTLVRFADDAAASLVVDVADHHTEVASVSLSGAVLSREKVPVGPGLTADERLEHTLTTVDAAVRAWPDRTRLLGVGVSIPGPVDSNGMVDFAPALGWNRVNLGPILRERLDVPVAVHNDANLIAIAEARFGAARHRRALFALAVFDGVGSGIVVDGKLWEGADGASGQIGRMLLSLESVQHIYPGFGDLESRLGTQAVRERATAAGVQLDPGGDVWRELLVELPARDPAAARLASQVLDEFAFALINVCALVNPDVIILAGYFAPIAEYVGLELRRRLTGRVIHVPEFLPESTELPGAVLGAALGAQLAFGPLEQLLD